MIEPMSIEVVFTSESTASGGGRDGHVKSTSGRIDLDTRPPKEAGGSGEGTNPEELFSAGYAACFLGAPPSVVSGRRQFQDPKNSSQRESATGAFNCPQECCLFVAISNARVGHGETRNS